MLKSDTCVIDGATYGVTQLPAMRAMRLFARIARVVGPALGKLSGGVDLGSIDAGAALEIFFDKVTPDEFEHVLTEFFWALSRDGKNIAPRATCGSPFDIEMAGQLGTILRLVKFAFEVNFGNFRVAAAALMSPAAEVSKP